MEIQRILLELIEFQQDYVSNISAGLFDEYDYTHLKGVIIGPSGTPYEGGKPPIVKFITKVYHPNIGESRSICVDILKERWNPQLTISKVLLSISSLLMDPNPNSPLQSDIARVYKEDKLQYEQNAREWTQKYAV